MIECSGYYLELSGEYVAWCKTHNRMSAICELLEPNGFQRDKPKATASRRKKAKAI